MKHAAKIFITLICTCIAFTAAGQTQKTHLLKEGLSAWQDAPGWQLAGDITADPANESKLTSKPGAGVIVNGPNGNAPNLHTKQNFADCIAHIEFMVPKGSNSGVYFISRYEIQVFDSWSVTNPAHSDCGGIYQRWDEKRDPKGYEGRPPKVNASLPPGSWQTFDVIFKAPRFDKSGKKIKNAQFVKVVHNGILVHKRQSLTGPTRASTFNDEKPTGPLMLQGDHGPVAYRNIWIKPLTENDDIIVNPFFAMDTGTKDDQHQTLTEQANLIEELGYAGFGHTNLDNLRQLLYALDSRDLKLSTVYLGVNLDNKDAPFDSRLKDAAKILNGRGTILWLYLLSSQFDRSSPEGDPTAIEIINQMADIIEDTDIKIAFYPHTNFWLETADDAFRLAQKIDRPNVGITFNLCHQLRVLGPESVEQTIKKVLPRLFVVTINGAESAPAQTAGWDKLIQPLDTGSFDIYPALKILRGLNYTGPVGLQHYGIKGPAKENLTRSITAWKKLNVKLNPQ
jgi:sugar phosphate isomerase/epimerase